MSREPRIVTDPDELVALYEPDRALHIYALADLGDPYWSASTWWRRGDAVVGIVGIPDADAPVVYAVSTADPAGTLALLRDLADGLPAGALVTAPVGAARAFRDAERPLAWHRRYRRYVLPPDVPVPPDPAGVVPLGADDTEELLALYASEPSAFFLASMIDDDTFVGVREHGALIAAAGTHVFSSDHRVAAIGGVFAHPDHRGRGLGRVVTAGVVNRVADRVSTIGLNCAERNVAARRVYEQLGFEPRWLYEECEIRRTGAR